MRLKTVMLAATILGGVPLAAHAQPIQGVYVGAGAGFNYAEPARIIGTSGIGAAAPRGNHYDFDAGFVGVGSVGYGFGNGVRVELEGNYRDAHVRKLSTTVNPTSTSGANQTYGGLANVLFDIDVGSPWVYPYLGAGAGVEATDLDTRTTQRTGGLVRIRDTQANFAFQAIAGLSFPVYGVPGLSVTTEYRFLGVEGHESFETDRTNVTLINPATRNTVTDLGTYTGRTKIGAQYNHAALVGVRYAFNVAPPAPAAAAVATAPAAAPARSYLVFFDWDRADLTDRARQIVAEAAQNATRVQYTRIEVDGYTDTSGTAAYNQRLSVRRAQNVAAELVRDGVPRQAISIQGFGETHLLVPTAQGVREPQNRRVEIVIR